MGGWIERGVIVFLILWLVLSERAHQDAVRRIHRLNAEIGDRLGQCEAAEAASSAALADCRETRDAEHVAAMACVEDLRRCDEWFAQREYARDRDF